MSAPRSTAWCASSSIGRKMSGSKSGASTKLLAYAIGSSPHVRMVRKVADRGGAQATRNPTLQIRITQVKGLGLAWVLKINPAKTQTKALQSPISNPQGSKGANLHLLRKNNHQALKAISRRHQPLDLTQRPKMINKITLLRRAPEPKAESRRTLSSSRTSTIESGNLLRR